MVLVKVGASGLAVMARMSRRASSMACSKAGS